MGNQTQVHYYSSLLKQKLQAVLNWSVTVIEAPSGYGKTTAMQDYLENHLPNEMSVHWWSASEGLADVSWARLCQTLYRLDPVTGQRLLSLGFPQTFSAWEIAQTIGRLHSDTASVLVLDDFHFLQRQLPQSVMTALLSHSGENIHLVVITQTTRPFARSVFQQAPVHYIRAEDLRLQAEDVKRYSHQCGLSISESEAQQLFDYTEGWIVAVYLMILQMKRGEGISPGLGILQLMENIVWAGLADEQRTVLFCLALFPDVTMEQLAFLLGEDALSQEVVDFLDETSFIRYEAERQRYVPHAILRDMLMRRLKAEPLHARTRYYRRAGAWYAGTHDTVKALQCYLQGKDFEAVLKLPLVELSLVRVDGTPFAELIMKPLQECSVDVKRRHPISLLRIAYALIGADKQEDAKALLTEVKAMIMDVGDAKKRESLLGEWMLVSSYLELPDIVRMVEVLQEADARIPGRCQTLVATEPFAFGMPIMFFLYYIPGRLDWDRQALAAAVQILARLTGEQSGADKLLEAESNLFRGYVAEAEVLGHQAVYLAEKSGQWSVRMGAMDLLGQVAVKQGRQDALSKSLEAFEDSVGSDAMSPYVMQCLRAGVYVWLEMTDLIPLWLKDGKAALPDAPDWMKSFLRYLHVCALLQDEDYPRLAGAAEAALVQSGSSCSVIVRIYLHLLGALGYYRMGRTDEALAHTKEAVALGLPDRIFLPCMEFDELLGDLVEKAFAAVNHPMPARIVTSGAEISSNWKRLVRYLAESRSLPYGLTEREMEVASLAAKGLTNKEIASDLYISEATVKFHLRTVFSKLDIDRRSKLPRMLD